MQQKTERKEKTGQGDEKEIKKHKGDVFRLGAMLRGDDQFEIPEGIKADMQSFVKAVKRDLPGADIFKQMGLGSVDPATVRVQILDSFGLND